MSEQQQSVPVVILEQLKLSRIHGMPFLVYSGAKNFMSDGNKLIMKIPNRKRIFVVKVVYDEGEDLYNLEFHKKKGRFDIVLANEIKGIFFDQMAEIIARELNIL